MSSNRSIKSKEERHLKNKINNLQKDSQGGQEIIINDLKDLKQIVEHMEDNQILEVSWGDSEDEE